MRTPEALFQSYRDKTHETAIYPDRGGLLGIAYTALKLVGEAGEFDTARTRDERLREAGDVLYYLAELGNRLRLPPFEERRETWTPSRSGPSILLSAAVVLAEQVGKLIRDGGTSPHQAVALQAVHDQWQIVLVALIFEMRCEDLSLFEVIEVNQAKLASRKARGVLRGSGGDR